MLIVIEVNAAFHLEIIMMMKILHKVLLCWNRWRNFTCDAAINQSQWSGTPIMSVFSTFLCETKKCSSNRDWLTNTPLLWTWTQNFEEFQEENCLSYSLMLVSHFLHQLCVRLWNEDKKKTLCFIFGQVSTSIRILHTNTCKCNYWFVYKVRTKHLRWKKFCSFFSSDSCSEEKQQHTNTQIKIFNHVDKTMWTDWSSLMLSRFSGFKVQLYCHFITILMRH